MSLYRVHNLREGSRNGNWLAYWENATGMKANWCHKLGCLQLATDGAHVQLDDSNDKRWYVVPLCHKCNCQFGEYFLAEGPLVSVIDPNVILW